MSKDKPFETANINIIGTINSLIVSKNLKLKVYSRSSIYANSEQEFLQCNKTAEDYVERFIKTVKY